MEYTQGIYKVCILAMQCLHDSDIQHQYSSGYVINAEAERITSLQIKVSHPVDLSHNNYSCT